MPEKKAKKEAKPAAEVKPEYRGVPVSYCPFCGGRDLVQFGYLYEEKGLLVLDALVYYCTACKQYFYVKQPRLPFLVQVVEMASSK